MLNPFPAREWRIEYLLVQSSVRDKDLPSVNAKTARQRGVRTRSVINRPSPRNALTKEPVFYLGAGDLTTTKLVDFNASGRALTYGSHGHGENCRIYEAYITLRVRTPRCLAVLAFTEGRSLSRTDD
ncbi:hypothetical protein NDU88_002325 [Pleurodeles waltl]|uniref:Uncharacterized protein n=1 Tax=Pleurodeles waltl TaxID=8319 RepID=A0AAV7RF43_PLEWA|nr:hypothetical protein NDU88_002325 [Pleurodeles waltl]